MKRSGLPQGVQADGEKQHDSLYHQLVEVLDVQEDHAVGQDSDDENTYEHAAQPSPAAGNAHPAEDHRSQDIQLLALRATRAQAG